MKAFYFLNYVVYAWYEKRDNLPMMFAISVPVVLMGFNILSITYLLSIIFNFSLPFTKVNVMIMLIALTMFSYVVLYRKKRYIEIFGEYKKKQAHLRRHRRYARLYIIASILFLLVTLVIADIRFDGHL